MSNKLKGMIWLRGQVTLAIKDSIAGFYADFPHFSL